MARDEGGAIWLDPEMMTPYQFWLQVADIDVITRFLKIFTFKSREEIETLAVSCRSARISRPRENAIRSPSLFTAPTSSSVCSPQPTRSGARWRYS